MEIKQSLQEEELQQITGSASICKMVKPLPTAELMNSSGTTEQTSVSHRGYSSLVVISETVVELICLLSCMVPARVCLGKSIVKLTPHLLTIICLEILTFGLAGLLVIY